MLDVAPEGVRVRRCLPRIDHLPAVPVERLDIGCVVVMAVQRDLERQRMPLMQLDEITKVVELQH